MSQKQSQRIRLAQQCSFCQTTYPERVFTCPSCGKLTCADCITYILDIECAHEVKVYPPNGWLTDAANFNRNKSN